MPVASLWIGGSLGPIEIASIKSFLRQQGEFALYSYEPIKNVPEGVTCLDARDVFDPGEIIRHKKTRSPAIHADLFRYALVSKTNYIWVDLDMIALRPFDFASEWVFADQSDGIYAIGVLQLPKTSLALKELCKFNKDTRGIPPFVKGLRRIKHRLRQLVAGPQSLSAWSWGHTGPYALTHYLNQFDEAQYSLPKNAFYCIPHRDVRRFVEPGALTQADFPAEAWGVHLWAKELRQVIDHEFGGVVPEGSYLAGLLAAD